MIRWTSEAAADFESIRKYIESDNPSAAARVSDAILAAVDQLDRYPRSGPASEGRRMRKLTVARTPYIIYYRLHPEAVILRGIVHGAMRLPRYLRR